jgi:hypothetical protein
VVRTKEETYHISSTMFEHYSGLHCY